MGDIKYQATCESCSERQDNCELVKGLFYCPVCASVQRDNADVRVLQRKLKAHKQVIHAFELGEAQA